MKQANACGVPAVVFDGCGPAEMVENGISGFVVPSGDVQAMVGAILTLCRDAERRRDMGLMAHERITSHFDIRSKVAEQIGFYERVIAETTGHRK